MLRFLKDQTFELQEADCPPPSDLLIADWLPPLGSKPGYLKLLSFTTYFLFPQPKGIEFFPIVLKISRGLPASARSPLLAHHYGPGKRTDGNTDGAAWNKEMEVLTGSLSHSQRKVSIVSRRKAKGSFK